MSKLRPKHLNQTCYISQYQTLELGLNLRTIPNCLANLLSLINLLPKNTAVLV